MEDEQQFIEVQSQLADMRPSMTVCMVDASPRTIVVVSSVSTWLPAQLAPVVPA